MMKELLNDQANQIERILAAQGLDVRIVGGTVGPRLVVFHAVKPATVKLSAVLRMDEEIALGLGVPTCRIARNGHHLTLEIPRRDPQTVQLVKLVERVPKQSGAVVVGVDEEDTPLLLPLDSPNIGHILIAGTTGSGKTALARAMIAGLALSHAVYELGLVLVDPKRRGYGPFAGLPHLIQEVLHEPEDALAALAWLVTEMERRDREGVSAPRLVVFIDELADLMLAAGGDGEVMLSRLVQRGREAGMHVVACTQKPTASVIGSLIKANFPVRIVGRVTDTNDAYVASGIAGTGAERLLGKGDFLVVAGGDTIRMQGAYIGESEIPDLVARLRGGRPFCAEEPRIEDRGSRIEDGESKIAPRDPRDSLSSILDPLSSIGGRRREAPTEAMIEFALAELEAHSEVTQRAVQRFHKEKYGTLCNTRRAQAAIDAAQERLEGQRNETKGVSDSHDGL